MVQLMTLFKGHAADSQGWCAHPEATPQTKHDRQPTHMASHMMLLWSMLIALRTRLGSLGTRHWLATVLANICILGGILAAPVVSAVAWIGLALPKHTLLHQMAPMLVVGSIVWFGVAIACAHAFRLDHHDDA